MQAKTCLLHFDWVKGHECKSVTIAKFVSTDLVASEGRQGSTVQPAMASTSGEERIPLKKRKRDCRYQQEWKQCGIIRSKRGPTFARCDTCKCDFSIQNLFQ